MPVAYQGTGSGAVMSRPGSFMSRYQPPQPTPVDEAYKNYGTAAKAQGQDYTNIMGMYKNIYDQADRTGTNLSNLANSAGNVNIPGYQSTGDYTKSFANLSGLASTGGFSPEDIANIRERAISPIRAVYGNASMNLARQRSLQGGYSPNFSAATTKMARQMSSQLSDTVGSANADIAQKVAQNKLAAAGPLAQLAAGEQASRNEYALKTADLRRQMEGERYGRQESAAELPLKTRLSAAGGMAGLYGTTPALTSLMGGQALNTAQLQENVNNNNFNRGLSKLRLFQ